MIRQIALLMLLPLTASTQTVSPVVDSCSTCPLYQAYKATAGFRLNQTLDRSLDWVSLAGSTGFLLGALIGTPSYNDCVESQDGECGLSLYGPAIVGAIASAATALGVAVPLGLKRGGRLRDSAQDDGPIRLRNERFGYEMVALYGATLASRVPDAYRNEMPGLFLNYRFFNRSMLKPDEVRLGYQPEVMWSNPGYPYVTNPEIREQRAELHLLWTLLGSRVFSLYFAPGIGFASAKSHYIAPLTNLSTTKSAYNTFLVNVHLGTTINLFDFLFARLDFSYEPYGSYQHVTELIAAPYERTLRYQISAGAFLF